MLPADYVFAAALVFVVGCSLYFAPRISGDRVAMQWGLDGTPNWYAPKWLALWWTAPFMLAIRILSGWPPPTRRSLCTAFNGEYWVCR
jgi:hypothetical protein